MAVSFVDAANVPATGDGQVSSRATSKPAGAQVAVVWITWWTGGGGATTVTPSGGGGTWERRGDVVDGSTRTVLFLKQVDADADGTTYTFTFNSSSWALSDDHSSGPTQTAPRIWRPYPSIRAPRTAPTTPVSRSQRSPARRCRGRETPTNTAAR